MQTADAVVRTATVIVTTGVATAEFKPLRRHFKQRETYLVMTAPVPAAVRRQLCPSDVTIRDFRTPHHRVRWTHDQQIVVSGADQEETPARTRDALLVQRTGQLMYELSTLYPEMSGIPPAYGWEAPLPRTADGLPYIGPHRNLPRHLFAFGNSSQSVTGAYLASRILLRHFRDEPDPADEVFAFTRVT